MVVLVMVGVGRMFDVVGSVSMDVVVGAGAVVGVGILIGRCVGVCVGDGGNVVVV